MGTRDMRTHIIWTILPQKMFLKHRLILFLLSSWLATKNSKNNSSTWWFMVSNRRSNVHAMGRSFYFHRTSQSVCKKCSGYFHIVNATTNFSFRILGIFTLVLEGSMFCVCFDGNPTFEMVKEKISVITYFHKAIIYLGLVITIQDY